MRIFPMVAVIIFPEKGSAQVILISGLFPIFIIRAYRREAAHVALRVLPTFMIRAIFPLLENIDFQLNLQFQIPFHLHL